MSSKFIKLLNVCYQKEIDKYKEERLDEIKDKEEFDNMVNLIILLNRKWGRYERNEIWWTIDIMWFNGWRCLFRGIKTQERTEIIN